jgi:photosystem II stability/assembly factor-like uncharacterized protein
MKLQRQTLIVLCAIAILIISPDSLKSQDAWTAVGAPSTGRIFTLSVVNGLGILAGTEDGGMFLSTDNGQNWAYHALAMNTVRSFYVHSDGRIFAGKQSGASVSTDNGVTWESLGLSTNENGFGMTVNSSGHIFVAGWRNGLNRSTDNGATWEVITTGMTQTRGDEVVVDATGILYAGMYNGGLHRSTDNGDSWTLAATEFEFKNIGAFEIVGSTVFAAIEYLGIYRTTDHGVTWTGSDNGFDEESYAALIALSATELYAATQDKVYHSTDAGDTWAATSTQDFDGSILSMVRTGTGRLILGTNWNGIWVSDDNGATWTNSSAGLTNVDVEALAADTDGRVYLSHRVPPITATTDHGMTWQDAGNQELGARQLFIAPSGNLYAASYNGVYMTSDKGVTWTADTTGMMEKNLSCVAVNASGDLFAGGSHGGCFRRLSNETSWTDVTNELAGYDITCMTATGTSLFVGTQRDGLYRSNDNGATWVDVSENVVDAFIYSIAFDPVRGLYVGAHNGVSHSTDLGATWTTRLGQNHPGNGVTGIVLAENDMIVTSSGYSGVQVLTGPTASWVKVNDGLFNTKIQAFVRDVDGYYYAGTEGNGVFRNRNIILGAEDPPAAAQSYTLGQNYPNPFNPSTTIRYGIPVRGHVSLTIYNALGVEVATLVDGMHEPGWHSISFDGSDLRSGQYFYRLRSGSSVLSRTMLLIK